MGPIDALWHVLNLFAVATLTGVLAAGGAKLLWRRQLARVAFTPLAMWAMVGPSVMVVAGLAFFDRDGRMLTYAAMVAACALTLWWRGFGPGSR
jgi:small neutral amino acid transporter SnatA (MarC family)